MIDHAPERHHRRVAEIVAELESDGWMVSVEPSASSLPNVLSDLRPDFIASRRGEILIGEVVSRRSAPREHIDLLAERIESIPNTRLEVYWLGDILQEPPARDHVLGIIAEAREVAKVGPRAAMLIAWAAFEGAITHFSSEVVDIERSRSPRQLLANVYSLGYISELDFIRLSHVYRVRSEIAHHASDAIPDPEDIEFTLTIAELLATGRYVSVDQMIEWFTQHYEDPANSVLYDSGSGGYQYFGNEPYDALDILSDQFSTATEGSIAAAVDTLRGMSAEWVKKNREP